MRQEIKDALRLAKTTRPFANRRKYATGGNPIEVTGPQQNPGKVRTLLDINPRLPPSALYTAPAVTPAPAPAITPTASLSPQSNLNDTFQADLGRPNLGMNSVLPPNTAPITNQGPGVGLAPLEEQNVEDPTRRQIEEIYANYLGRPADQGGFDYWYDLLQRNALNPTQFQGYVEETPESQQYETTLRNAYQQAYGKPATSEQEAVNWAQSYRQANPSAYVKGTTFTPPTTYAPDLAAWRPNIQNSNLTTPPLNPALNPNAPTAQPSTPQSSGSPTTPPSGATETTYDKPIPVWNPKIPNSTMDTPSIAPPLEQLRAGEIKIDPKDYGSFVTSLFNQYLNRDPKEEGLNFFTNNLMMGVSPAEIATTIATTPQAQANQVGSLYQYLMGQNADENTINYFKDQINQGKMDLGDVGVSLMNSPEYADYQNQLFEANKSGFTPVGQYDFGATALPDGLGEVTAMPNGYLDSRVWSPNDGTNDIFPTSFASTVLSKGLGPNQQIPAGYVDPNVMLSGRDNVSDKFQFAVTALQDGLGENGAFKPYVDASINAQKVNDAINNIDPKDYGSFVTQVTKDLTGKAMDQGQVKSLSDQLNAGRITPQEVATQIARQENVPLPPPRPENLQAQKGTSWSETLGNVLGGLKDKVSNVLSDPGSAVSNTLSKLADVLNPNKGKEFAVTLGSRLAKDYGLTVPQVSGILAHIGLESAGFQSNISEGKPLVPNSRGGYGYVQWTGDRRKALEKFAKDKGLDVSKFDTQYQFMQQEPEFEKYIEQVKKTNTMQDAARAFQKYESGGSKLWKSNWPGRFLYGKQAENWMEGALGATPANVEVPTPEPRPPNLTGGITTPEELGFKGTTPVGASGDVTGETTMPPDAGGIDYMPPGGGATPTPGMGPSGDFGGGSGVGAGVEAVGGGSAISGGGGSHTNTGGGASHPVTHTSGVSHSPVHTGTHDSSFGVGYANDPYFGHAGVGGSGHIGGSHHTGGHDPYFGHSSGSYNASWAEQDRNRGMYGTDAELDAMKKRGGRVTRGLEVAKRADGGRAVKEALNIARRGRRGYTTGGAPTELVVGSNPAIATPQTTAVAPTSVAATSVAPQVPAAQQPISYYSPFLQNAYQTFFNRAPDSSGEQYWSNLLDTGALSQGDVLNYLTQTQGFQNLYNTDPTAAITAMYRGTVMRDPESGGLQYWQQQLQNGLPPSELMKALVTSNEYKNAYDISNAYQNYVGTMPSYEQMASAKNALRSGKTMSDVTDSIASSPEATTNFVTTAYQSMLGRPAETGGLNYWSNLLNTGAIDKTYFLNVLAGTTEGINHANTQTFNNMFERLTGRLPSAAEMKDPNSLYNDALSKMAAGTLTHDQLQAAVSLDPEAVNYENTNLVKDTFQALTGRQPTPEEQDDLASKLAAGALDSDKLFAQISAMPESQAYLQSNNTSQVNPQGGKQITEIVSARPGVTTVRYNDGTIEQRSGDFGWRQNNPGNVKYSSKPNWWGHQFGAMEGGKATDGGTFAVFPSLEAGNAARGHLLFESPGYKDMTLKQAMYQYAPKKTNPRVDDYIDGMAKAAGVSINTKMRDFTPEQRQAAMDSQVKSEGNRPGQVKIISLPSKPPVTVSPPTLATPEGLEGVTQSTGETGDGGVGGLGGGSPGIPSMTPITGIGGGMDFSVPSSPAPTYTPPHISTGISAPISHTPVTHTGGVSHSPVHTGTHDSSFGVGYANDPYFGHAGVGGSGHIGGATHTGGSDPYFGHHGVGGHHVTITNPHNDYAKDGAWWELGYNKGGRVTRGLEIAKRADGGSMGIDEIKDVLRLAKNSARDPLKRKQPRIEGEITMAPEPAQPARRPAPYSRFNDFNRMLKNPPQVESPAHDPQDPKYYIKPEEYREGVYDDIYGTRYNALARGGSVAREGYALGGSPTESLGAQPAGLGVGSNPAIATPMLSGPGVGIGMGGSAGGSGAAGSGSYGGGSSSSGGSGGVSFMNKGGAVWDKPRPKSLGKPDQLSKKQKSSAKAAAKAAGRPYPNLVDNMRAAQKSHGGPLSKAMNLTRRVLDE